MAISVETEPRPGRGSFVILELLGIGLLTGDVGGEAWANCQKDYSPCPPTIITYTALTVQTGALKQD